MTHEWVKWLGFCSECAEQKTGTNNLPRFGLKPLKRVLVAMLASTLDHKVHCALIWPPWHRVQEQKINEWMNEIFRRHVSEVVKPPQKNKKQKDKNPMQNCVRHKVVASEGLQRVGCGRKLNVATGSFISRPGTAARLPVQISTPQMQRRTGRNSSNRPGGGKKKLKTFHFSHVLPLPRRHTAAHWRAGGASFYLRLRVLPSTSCVSRRTCKTRWGLISR